MEPNPIYGPKDQSQDERGREMEKKYTGGNLVRYDKLQFEAIKKKAKSDLKQLKEKVNEETKSL